MRERNREEMENRRAYASGSAQRGMWEILSYVVMGLVLLYIILLFVFTGGSRKPFSEVSKSFEGSIHAENMKSVGAQGLKRYYGLNGADYDGVLFYVSEHSMSADEILLIKAKNEEQVQEIESAIDRHLQNRIEDFDGYAPDEAKLLKDAERSTRGTYIFLCVSKDAKAYKKAFVKSL